MTTWSNRPAFLLATIGGAVGLGNLWRFPYIAGENGGGGFVIVYLIFVFLLGLPIIAGEMLIGRRGRQNAILSGLIPELFAQPIQKFTARVLPGFQRRHKLGDPYIVLDELVFVD